MARLEVKVVGYPKPETRWLKQGEEIIPSDEYQIENLEDGTSILVINDVYPDDTGEIVFEAYNSVGVAQTITEFMVEGNMMDLEAYH
jgi:titin